MLPSAEDSKNPSIIGKRDFQYARLKCGRKEKAEGERWKRQEDEAEAPN